jgi:hypothetical protein
MTALVAPPAPGRLYRLPASIADTGGGLFAPPPQKYRFNDPILQGGNGIYYGYFPAAAKWTGHILDSKKSLTHPILWHRGTINAIADRPTLDFDPNTTNDVTTQGPPAPFFMREPKQPYGKKGFMPRSPRAIVYACTNNEAPAYVNFFTANAATWDKYNIFICRSPCKQTDIETALPWGIYNFHGYGWLDVLLLRDNVVVQSDVIPGVGTLLTNGYSTDNTRYVGGQVYEVIRSHCLGPASLAEEYWFPVMQPDGNYVNAANLTNTIAFKTTQAAAKAKACAKYRCTVICYNDHPAPMAAGSGFDVQSALNNSIIAGLNAGGNGQWQQLAPSTPLDGTNTDPTIAATVNGLLPDIKSFFGIT